MASKKFTLLAILVICAAATGFSQLGGVIDYLDSTKVSSRNLPKYNEWKNNSKSNYFPPKPRNMGQLALYGGLVVVDGDCPPTPGYNIGLSYRKALGYVISLRGGIGYAQAKGLDYRQNPNLGNSKVLLQNYSLPNTGYPNAKGPGWYVHNYKTTIWTPTLDFIINFNNVMFHKNKSKFGVYGLLGYSPIIYKTELNALSGAQAYNFGSLLTNNKEFFNRPRADIRSDLESFFDDSFETPASVDDRSPNFDNGEPGKSQLRHSFSVGLGTEFRIASRMSLGLEFKYLATRDDYIDGWFLNNGGLTPSKDNLIFTNLFINFNL
jgi:opacity protein-like surface antigen